MLQHLSEALLPQTKALRGSRRPEATFEARGARLGGVLNTAYLEAIDNNDYESESDDEGPSRDNLRRSRVDVSSFHELCHFDRCSVFVHGSDMSTNCCCARFRMQASPCPALDHLFAHLYP